MMKNELSIGSLIYDCTINDYGLIIDCAWTERCNPIYKYYLIHWQKTEKYNIHKKVYFKWPAAHLHNRIVIGEVMIINDEKTKIKNTNN